MRDIPMQLKILEIVKEYESKEEKDKMIKQSQYIPSTDSFGNTIAIPLGNRNIRKFMDINYLYEHSFSDYTISYIRENIRLMEECGYIKTKKARPIKLEPNFEIINITNTGYDFIENKGKKSIAEIKVQNLEDIPEQLKILNKYIEEITFLKTDEIVLMKSKLEELKKNDTNLPWDTLINGINLLISMASILKK